MKAIIVAAILSTAACARLDHLTYLPPNQRLNNGNFGSHSNVAQGYSSGLFGAQAGSNAQVFSSNGLNQVAILKFASDNDGQGSYRYNYETANSIQADQQGDARDGNRAHGSYSYTSPEGEHIAISYTADENGYVAQGSHIPTAPPIPEAILKSLQENAAAEARGIFDDGSYRGEGLNDGQYNGEGQTAAGRFAKNAFTNGGYSANGGYKY